MLAGYSRFTSRDKSQCYIWIIPFSLSFLCVFSWRLLKRRRRKNEKLHRNNRVYSPGIVKKPTTSGVSFIFLLITYMFSITGILTIITLTLWDGHLQTPMCFFLRNFSLVELSFTTLGIPKFLATIITREKTISFNDCKAVFLFVCLGFVCLFVFSFSWESLSFTFWLPCPMTATLPSANCCITWPSWIIESAHCLFWPLGWLHS